MPEIIWTLLPILGLKTDVPANDISLLKALADGVFATYAAGGYNFDTTLKRNACSKATAFNQWSASANAQATKCLGLFELYDGTTRDHIFWDNGKLYVFDGNKDPQDKTTAATTYQNADTDLVSAVRVGSDVVFTDNTDGVTIQAWANGDANAAKAIHQYTEFKFRYLEYFARRIVGAYSDQTNGDIDIRWSNALPTAQTDCYFESSNGAGDWQLYVPNDDPIKGIKNLGHNTCIIYSEDSISHLTYYPNFTTPFQVYVVVQGQGGATHHSIVNIGNRHLFFNANYGFCEYRGGNEIIPISDNIEDEITSIKSSDYGKIVGTYAPFQNEAIWTAPTIGKLFAYNYRTGEWRVQNNSFRFIDVWNIYGDSYTWTEMISDLTDAGYGASPTWNDLIDYLGPTATWLDLTGDADSKVVGADTDGQLYQLRGSSDHLGGIHSGLREEPILDFGDARIKKLITEVWFDLGKVGSYNLDVWHRSGDTVGELEAQSWGAPVDTISCDSPEFAAVRGKIAKSSRYHQIRWGNEENNAQFEVNKIVIKAQTQGY